MIHLAEKQLRSSKPANYRPKQTIAQPTFSSAQALMLDRCLKGPKAYPEDYFRALPREEARLIIYRCNTTHQVLNELRQTKLNQLVKALVTTTIPNICGNAADLLIEPVLDRNFQCDLSIKSLFLSKAEIVVALIKANILPTNFYSL